MRDVAPRNTLTFWGIFNVEIGRMQYQHGSSASPCVTGWLLKGTVALITSSREVRRRSSFEKRAHSPPIKVSLGAKDEDESRDRGDR